MIVCILTAATLAGNSWFLWGPRQPGKSLLLRTLFPTAPSNNLSSAREFRRFAVDPGVFSEECAALLEKRQPVIVDEIQETAPSRRGPVAHKPPRPALHPYRLEPPQTAPRPEQPARRPRRPPRPPAAHVRRDTRHLTRQGTRPRPSRVAKSSTPPRSPAKSASPPTRSAAISTSSWTRSWPYGCRPGPSGRNAS
jgi:hypothetical protein